MEQFAQAREERACWGDTRLVQVVQRSVLCRPDGQPLPAADGYLNGTGPLMGPQGKKATIYRRGMCWLRNGWVSCTCFLLQTVVHDLDHD